MDTNILKISSEADAWALLEKTLTEGVPEGPFDLVFNNWPVLEFRLRGDKFESSLTVKVMEGFVDLQKKINRAYAQMRYNKPTSVGLTVEEKDQLQIIVYVDEGSSIFKIDLQDAMETFLKGAINNMTGKEIVVTILGISLIYGGVTCTKAYFEHEREMKQIETTSFLSDQETQRMEVFAKALGEKNELHLAADDAVETYNKILKGASEADILVIGDTEISREVIQDLVKQKRSRSEETQLNGIYRVQKIDNTNVDGFFITLKSEEDGRTFTAKLEDKWFFRREANVKQLEDALWDRKPVYLRVNGKELRGEVTQAVILDVGNNEVE